MLKDTANTQETQNGLNCSDYDFELPEELIAKYPCTERDESRLLHYKLRSKILKHQNFKDIVDILEPGDILVRNSSRVLPARLYLNDPETGGRIEILLLKEVDTLKWQILAKPFKRLKDQRHYLIGSDLRVLASKKDDEATISFSSAQDFSRAISEYGEMPIPPYLKRQAEDLDKERYQSVYAQEFNSKHFSIAAPTAGLHFTPEIISALEKKGIEFLDVNLDVGLGTFLPVKVDDIRQHKMHAEYYEVPEAAWQKIQNAKKQKRRIIAVGSTSARSLESVAASGKLCGETEIFIYPPYEFQVIDGMLTNFHLPKSTLLMMISALSSLDEIKNIYREAVEQRYRFFSYGDACLFL